MPISPHSQRPGAVSKLANGQFSVMKLIQTALVRVFRGNVAKKMCRADPPACFRITYTGGMSGETPTAPANITFGRRRSFTGNSFLFQIRHTQLPSASGTPRARSERAVREARSWLPDEPMRKDSSAHL